MANNDYVPLRAEPPFRLNVEREDQGPPRRASGPTLLRTSDPRFNPPTPSPLKRAALLLFVFCLFWSALRLRTMGHPPLSPIPDAERFHTDLDYLTVINDERTKNTRTRLMRRLAR